MLGLQDKTGCYSRSPGQDRVLCLQDKIGCNSSGTGQGVRPPVQDKMLGLQDKVGIRSFTLLLLALSPLVALLKRAGAVRSFMYSSLRK